MMHTIPLLIQRAAVAVILVLMTAVAAEGVGGRLGGDVDMPYESLNSGGCSFATNAASTIKLGGSIGQAGLIYICTNSSARAENGFWKAEGSCELYPAGITDISLQTNDIGITFAVINSNTYQVLYVTEETGGIGGGSHTFTNVLSSFTGKGLAGSSTTVWENVSSVTNAGRYYLIKCEP